MNTSQAPRAGTPADNSDAVPTEDVARAEVYQHLENCRQGALETEDRLESVLELLVFGAAEEAERIRDDVFEMRGLETNPLDRMALTKSYSECRYQVHKTAALHAANLLRVRENRDRANNRSAPTNEDSSRRPRRRRAK